MVLLLGQLIYTSFSHVGFQALTSAAIPLEIRRAFIDQIVYRSWDSYNPPGADYRAVYLYRVSPEHTLFGWLYSDGVDEFGRSHVPYFVCYYFAGLLRAAHLEVIFSCLSNGPIRVLDRQFLPDRLESVVIENHQHYRSARPGVAISPQLQEQSYKALQQEKLFQLFIPGSEHQPSFVETIELPTIKELASPQSLSTVTGEISRIDLTTDTIAEIETLIESPEQSTAETYKQILLAKITNASPQQQAELPFNVSRLGLIVGAVSLIALIAGSSYLVRRSVVATIQPTSTVSIQSPANRPENLILAKTLNKRSGPVWSVVLSPDGRTLISGSADQTVKIWNVETGTVLNILAGHRDVPRSLVLTPDRKNLISGSGDRTIKIWNLRTNQPIQTLEQQSPVWSVVVSPDGQTLISGSEDGSLKAWNLQTRTLRFTIPAHNKRIFSVVVSPDGKTVATASLDGTLKLWNLQPQKLVRTITGHRAAVRALAFSPNGQMLASASWDKTLKLWNLQTGALIRTFTGHRSRAVAIAFSPDGQTLVSGSVDNTVKLWSVQEGILLRTLSNATDWVLSIAIDANHLVSGSKDQTIRIWKLR